MECRIARGLHIAADGLVVTERKSLIGRGRLSATLLMAPLGGREAMAEMTTPFLERSRRSASA